MRRALTVVVVAGVTCAAALVWTLDGPAPALRAVASAWTWATG